MSEFNTICEFKEEREMTPEQVKVLRAAIRKESRYFIPYCPCPPSMFSITYTNSPVQKGEDNV